MAVKRFGVVLFLLYFGHVAQSSHILALFPSLSFSDHYVYRAYLALLAQRGHSIVVMTPYPGHLQFPEKDKIVELDVGEASAPFWEEYKKLMTNTNDYYKKMRVLDEFSVKLVIAQLKSKQMQALFINPNLKFDLVVTEAEVPVLYAVADKYNAPHITFTTGSGTIPMYEARGCSAHPLLYPDVNTLNYGDLNIWQQITEVNRYFQTKREYYNEHLHICQLAAEKLLGLKRSLREVEEDIDMLFVSANPALIGNRPVVSSVAYVDRLQVKPGHQLPEDMKNILDAAKSGVVLFTIGTLQQSEQLSSSMLQKFADAFRELPYTVLWKIGNTTMFNKPDNVIALPWIPQQEVLAHPNVKAFITHGGPRSLEEAIYYSVPIIGLPLLKPRKTFIGEVTKHGAGVILDPYSMDKNDVKEKITAVVSDEKYKKAIKLLKQKVQDPVLSGPEHAVWWTEYVIRHQGGRHLRSPAVGQSFCSYYMLDLLGVLLLLTLVLLWAVYLVLRFVLRDLKSRFSGNKETDSPGKFKAL